MFDLPRYKNPISLIPGGCPQLLDFAAEQTLLKNIQYTFEEIPEHPGSERVQLHAFRKNEDGDFVDEMDSSREPGFNAYDIKGEKCLAPWLGQWLPLPYLRTREQNWPGTDDCRFEYGPSNWARGRLILDAENRLRLVLAFDMQVEEKNHADKQYSALCQDDVDANAHFRLAWRFRDNAWFMDLPWVEEWLREIWLNWQRNQPRRQNDDDELRFQHLASYLVLLEVINATSNQAEVYVVRPDSSGCVDVDLVLDIGNSRTTGILVETHTQSATNLNDSYLLQLRDMDEPEKVYTDPFETRVEFSEIRFGNDSLSLRSGRRTPAFAWPSPVRIGPEAARLATLSRCEKGTTGMSSPKRYLWDERDWKRSWRFNTKDEKAPYVTRGPLAQRINSSGTPLCCMDDKVFQKSKHLSRQERESAFESLFTRSSLMMFLLVEIIQQALLTINSPGQRCRHESPALPRRLRQIIFTTPGGMSTAERNIYRRWARWAVKVLWESLGWMDYYSAKAKTGSRATDYRDSPQIRSDWDEATCTQLVFIYNEITRKFQGDAQLFCKLLGRPRKISGFTDKRPSIRMATIDIGGGTTDLSITTFALESREGESARFIARPNFHDGFNLAGDDILRAVISEHVLESIGQAMSTAGVKNIDSVLRELFGRDKMDSEQEAKNQRIQFIRQVAVPAALMLLALYEQADLSQGTANASFSLGDCFLKDASSPANAQEKQEEAKAAEAAKAGDEGKEAQASILPMRFPMPGQAALDYLQDYVRQHGSAPGFDLLSIPIQLDARRMDESVRGVLQEILANLCEVIHLYDCDVLLLTGRPSRWPGIVQAITALLPLPPSRVYPMNDYRVGGWYPFKDALGKISDPKTTVVVGAILCALAEGQLEGFSFDPQSLKIGSTARYIGEMELNGQIKKDKVWFVVDPEKHKVEPETAEISFSGPMSIGFRQLEAERWTTTRYYFLDFASDEARRENARLLPFKVKLNLNLPDEDSLDAASPASEGEALTPEEGEFVIGEITGKNGDSPRGKPLEIRLQTLPRDDGFWMDTGIVKED